MQAARMIGSRAAWKAAARVMLALTTMVAPAGAQERGGSGQQAEPDPLKWRFMGPSVGNRIAAVAGVPGDPTIYYAGAASGGVWKSTDSGATFTPVFDGQRVAAIGALAVAATDPNIVWAGTGEAWVIRPSDVIGDGIYKSTDAGATWTRMGLEETGRIGRVIVHPTDPNIVYACALGRTTGPQQERGVYKTTDGGRTWNRVLFVDTNTGCSGLSMDARNPEVLFAGTWQVEMHPWAMLSGGPGSGIYVTRDGGATWTRVTQSGLPKSPVGKVDVAVAPSDSSRVYALIQTADQGSLWRSDDGGRAWKVVSWDRALIGRAGYYVRLGDFARRRGRSARREQQLTSLDRRGRHLPAVGRLRRLPRHLVRSEERRSLRDDRRRRDANHDEPRSESSSASGCRSVRCITSPSTIRCRTTSTATCRTTGRCAVPATLRKPLQTTRAARARQEADGEGPVAAGAAARLCRGITCLEAVSPDSPFPIRPTRTSCGPLATATS